MSAIALAASASASLAQSTGDYLPDFHAGEDPVFERPILPVEPGFEPADERPRLSIDVAGARISPDFKRRGLRVEIPMELAFGIGAAPQDEADEDAPPAFGR